MGFLERLSRSWGGAGEMERLPLTAKNLGAWAPLADGGGVGAPATGVPVTPERAIAQSAVFACVRILAESVAQLPAHAFRRTRTGREQAFEHRVDRLVSLRPNPEQTPSQFKETVQAHAAMWGNGYAEIELNGAGDPVALWPLLPNQTTVSRVDGQKVYHTLAGGRWVPLPAYRVFHLPGLGFDGLRGYNPLVLARNAIGLALAAEEYGSRFFGNGARPAGVLTHPAELDDEGRDRLRAQWSEMYGGLANSHRTAILEEGMQWQAMGLPPEAAELLATRRFQVPEIARFWRIPPHMLADLERATFSNIEHQSLEFIIHTLQPWLIRWEEALSWDLFRESERGEFYVKFNLGGLLRGDVKTRSEAYSIGRQWGWWSVNDVREMEDRNPVPGGDVYLQPLNMVPAGWTPEPRGDRALPPPPPAGARAAEGRDRFQQAHRAVLAAAAGGVLRAEANAVRREARRIGEGGQSPAFQAWARDFYASRPEAWARAMAPGLAALAAVVADAAAADVGAERQEEELQRFVTAYGQSLAAREIARSLDDLARTPAAELEALLGAWENDRAAELAASEAVRLGGAVAREVYSRAGVRSVGWHAPAGEGEACRAMHGRTVSASEPFLREGETIPGDAAGPAARAIRHPPLRPGCRCQVVAA